MLFGAHMSTGGGVWKALQRGTGIGCDIVQLFVKNNMQWFGKPHAVADLKLYANEVASGKIKAAFGHTGYRRPQIIARSRSNRCCRRSSSPPPWACHFWCYIRAPIWALAKRPA